MRESIGLTVRRWTKRGVTVGIVFLSSTLLMGSYDSLRAYEEPRMEDLRATSLASVGWSPGSLWRQTTLVGAVADALQMERPFPGAASKQAHQAAKPLGFLYISPPDPEGHKIVRSGRISLVVSKPDQAAEQVRLVAEQLGGYVVGLDFDQNEKEQGAGVVIRVPAERFEEARVQLKALAARVERETIEAEDVTKDYVDLESTLRNQRSEEQQYLAIMRRAMAVKDVLEVSARLADVRGRIEKTSGELRFLSHKVAMASIRVDLRMESEAELMGVQWRPTYRARVAFRNGLQSVANYADAMLALLLKLPAILLWASTIILLVKFGWKLLAKLWGQARVAAASVRT